MAKIDVFFQAMCTQEASDMHLAVGGPPALRINGTLRKVNYPPLTDRVLRPMLYEILSEQQIARFEKTHDLDFGYSATGIARFRCNYYYKSTGIAAFEVLVATPAVRSLIREQKTFQLTSTISIGRKDGMQTLDQHLLDLVQQKLVDPIEAAKNADQPAALLTKTTSSAAATPAKPGATAPAPVEV